MGIIYKRGNIYWVKYYRNGKPYRESTKSVKEADAKRLLKKREGEISEGKLPGIYFDRITFNELANDFLEDYKLNRRKSMERAEVSVKRLKEHFDGIKVTRIDTGRIKSYINTRLEEGAADATVNLELKALQRMLNLGAKETPPKVNRVPYIPFLKPDNVRQGFFEKDEYLALLKALPSYLRSPVIFAYRTGWRKGEILGLTWDKVDLKEGTVRLNPGETKNDRGRMIYLDDELLKLLKIQWIQRAEGREYVFHNQGTRIGDFRKAWTNACKRAKIEGKLFHDFRRTAVRNMTRSGIQETIAMKVTGHKTRAVFDRYNIVSGEDLKEAAKQQQAYLESER
jgi:integrase